MIFNNSEVVFLRGFPRSGTNWVCKLLNLHPEIKCSGEFHLQVLYKSFEEFKKFNGSCVVSNKETLAALEIDFNSLILKTIAGKIGNYKIICDRTPQPLSTMLIPDSKYIRITRDGRDNLVSWFYHTMRIASPVVLKQYPAMKEKAVLLHNNKDYFELNPKELLSCEAFFRQTAKHWNHYILSDNEICSKFDQGFRNISYFHIEYETLHAETEKIRNELYSFLNVEPVLAKGLSNDTMPGFKKHDALSHNRKGEVGGWQKYFNDTYAKWFDEEASEGLKLLNYGLTQSIT
tara:strand:- start:4753 stop:5622 length:870 start_codon:yes stop_codon:yes gene_type:complete